jgi:hypothetical protein
LGCQRQLRVIRVTVGYRHAPFDVRYSSNRYRIAVSKRNDAEGQERTFDGVAEKPQRPDRSGR